MLVSLVEMLMSLRKIKRGELSEKADVSVAALSRFLSGQSELKAEALFRVLAVLGADVEKIIRMEVGRALGTEEKSSLGEDVHFLLERTDPISRKTIADTLIASLKNETSPEFQSRIARVKEFRDSIQTVRRVHC